MCLRSGQQVLDQIGDRVGVEVLEVFEPGVGRPIGHGVLASSKEAGCAAVIRCEAPVDSRQAWS
jgi:hypothetical protein